MSADLLRRAAALMRKRAEAADSGPWVAAAQSTHADWFGLQSPYFALGNVFDRANAEHIASWHPTVALAVADWLDCVAAPFDQMWDADEDGILWGYDLDGDPLRFDESQDSLALAVATAYLGESA